MSKRLSSMHQLIIASPSIVLIWGLMSGALAAGISATNVDSIPRIISGERGQPTVVLLFSSRCSLSQNLWPRFLNFANQNRDKRISFLTFSTDKRQDDAIDFISRYNVAFNCYWVEPWPAGALDASMRPTGIQIGKTFNLPLVAVLDSSGGVVGQWQGLQDMSPIIDALKAINAM